MAIITGLVQEYNTNFGKYNIRVGGEWYFTKMEYAFCQPVTGDNVSFDNCGSKFTKNLKIIKHVNPKLQAVKVKEKGDASLKAVGSDVTFVKPNESSPECKYKALTSAVTFLQSKDHTKEQVVEMAMYFESYLSGSFYTDKLEDEYLHAIFDKKEYEATKTTEAIIEDLIEPEEEEFIMPDIELDTPILVQQPEAAVVEINTSGLLDNLANNSSFNDDINFDDGDDIPF